MSPRSRAAWKTSGVTWSHSPRSRSARQCASSRARPTAIRAIRCRPTSRPGADDGEVAVGGHAEQLLDRRVAQPAARRRRDDEQVRAPAADDREVLAVVERLELLHVGSVRLLLQQRDVVGAGVAVRCSGDLDGVGRDLPQLGRGEDDGRHLEAGVLPERPLQRLLDLGPRPQRAAEPDVAGVDVGLHVGEPAVLDRLDDRRLRELPGRAEVDGAEERDVRGHAIHLDRESLAGDTHASRRDCSSAATTVGDQRLPRRSCSRSMAWNSALKLPLPKPSEPCRSISSKNTVGRSPRGLVKICRR